MKGNYHASREMDQRQQLAYGWARYQLYRRKIAGTESQSSDPMHIFLTLLRFILTALVGILTLAVVALVATHFYVAPSLPPVDNLRELQLQVPLRIYTQKSRLLGEFGEKRRSPAT